MKKFKNVGIGAAVILIIIALIFLANAQKSAKANDVDIKLAARRASVQVQMYTPVIKVSYTHPPPEEEKFTKKTLNEELAKAKEDLIEYLEEKIRFEIEQENLPKYNTYLTGIEVYGHEPKSKTGIPIGSIKGVPKEAKYPERVLVAYKTEEKDVKPWEKDSEEDVLAISEVAGVSISKAQAMLAKIQGAGYTVSKEEVSEDSEITLLWFDDGWTDSYPTTLNWEVKCEGTEGNILVGYDSGVLITKPIPDDTRVYVKAGYLDLKTEFKPKSSEVETLESEIERLEKSKEELEKDLEESRAKEPDKPYKRDIRNATMMDLVFRTVKLEIFWMMSKASGVYMGNAQVREDMQCYSWKGKRTLLGKQGSFVLTNAHVAAAQLKQVIWVSEDNEILYIVGPGYPSIRYTQHSDMFGSPADLLAMDNQPVYSDDYDCAVYVTTAIAGYKENAAKFADSDMVKDGTRVVMVGNPSGFQKFATEGIISNSDYPTILAYENKAEAFKHSRMPAALLKPTMWIDAPIGAGGTSGSGIWAIEGSQAGKVVSLHNGGMHTGVWVSEMKTENHFVGSSDSIQPDTGVSMDKLINITPEQKKRLFENHSYRDAVFNQNYRELERKTPGAPFIQMMKD